MFVNVLSMLIVSGGATLFAQSLGKDEHEEAQRFYTCSIILMILCGVVMTFVGQLFTEPIIRVLGADDTVLDPTVSYARVLFAFMVPLVLYQQLMVYALSLLFTGFNTIIIYYFQVQEREIGATGISLLSGTILPVILLYLFTFFFGVNGTWWCYLSAQGLVLVLSVVLYMSDRKTARIQETEVIQ